MKKMRKIVVSLFCLALFLFGGSGVFAAAPEATPLAPNVSPRFLNIVAFRGNVEKNGDQITCLGHCQTANRTTIKITITLKDSAGRTLASASRQKTGTSHILTTDFDVTPGKNYTVVFTCDAGGERASDTIKYTA